MMSKSKFIKIQWAISESKRESALGKSVSLADYRKLTARAQARTRMRCALAAVFAQVRYSYRTRVFPTVVSS